MKGTMIATMTTTSPAIASVALEAMRGAEYGVRRSPTARALGEASFFTASTLKAAD